MSIARVTAVCAVAAALAVVTVPALATTGSFVDDDASVHEADIERLVAEGITTGCNPPLSDRFCPEDVVTRGQMASFLVRANGYAAGGDRNAFGDDDSSVHEQDIDLLAAAGVTSGCNPPANDRFCPDDPVTRGQMAAFLARAYGFFASPDVDAFTDDAASVFHSDINRLAAAAVTTGCNPPTNNMFCPEAPVTRGQMASFMVRAMNLVPIPPVPGTRYVTPGDVGESIGAGAVAPFPTKRVSSQVLSSAGATLENVVIDGCVTVEADDVTLRNVVVNCDGFFAVWVTDGDGLTITHSTVTGLSSEAKLVKLEGSAQATITDSVFVGGEDLMFADGPLDGLVFARNYRRDPLGDEASHYDGFQLGEFQPTPGEVVIAYNYFEPVPAGLGVTDLVFATNYSQLDIDVIGNYIGRHGYYTLRAYSATSMVVRDNVFDSSIERVALFDSSGSHTFECNHFASGPVVTADHIVGDGYVYEGCG